jgi:D-alanyl-D-alanine carboxypeptidase
LLLFGVTQGVDNMDGALAAEQTNLAANYGVPKGEYAFIDGSGGGNSSATGVSVTHFLLDRITRATFPTFFNSLPILAIDGSLVIVTDFESDPTLAGAKGNVRAKSGTFVAGTPSGLVLKSRAMAGYVQAQDGKQLVFEVVVNNVPVSNLNDVIRVFQDEGTISAILWRDN